MISDIRKSGRRIQGQKEEAFGLVLYKNYESSWLMIGNQSKSLILKMGSTLNESQTGPKIKDRKELVLDVEYVKEKQVNTKKSKDISTTVEESSNNDISTSKKKGVKITYVDPITE